jgi:hypothetical protein
VTQSRRNRWIMGSAISLAALATAIDHTHHPLPQAVVKQTTTEQPSQDGVSPCGLGGDSEVSPCGLGGDSEDQNVSPCSL